MNHQTYSKYMTFGFDMIFYGGTKLNVCYLEHVTGFSVKTYFGATSEYIYTSEIAIKSENLHNNR